MPKGLLAALVVTAAAAACTSTSTSVTAPTAEKCQVSAGSAPAAFGASGGGGTIAVTAARDCAWSVATSVPWVTITGSRSGQGDASIAFTVASNPAPAKRTGAISVADQDIQLSQDGAPCRYTISRGGDTVGAAGGTLSVDLTTLTGCSWTASSSANWLSIAAGSSGNASATVRVSVASNGGTARVGQVNVAGQLYTVNQEGVAPPPAPTPTPSPTPTPTPAPAPGPTPAPTPAPPPPPPSSPTPVSFVGSVSSISGRCPNLTMTVGGRTVVTDNGTRFQGLHCDHIDNGQLVAIDGTSSGGTVHADTVAKAGNDDE